MPSKRATVKRSKEKEQKQVSATEIILMTSFTVAKSCILQLVFDISTRSRRTGFTVAPHGIPNVLNYSWRVSRLPGSYRDASDGVFN
ncbi:hypothetical protein AVEN_137456-1 [Araneus ventricosus]|uniref:Uncharacterized protein n=1 Tax=Araneus ventricosus TaxID=182803 RepID=A0A4Y2FAV1_ARAVE|nr:hypothetical protein AVEN_137456-1 [Araneus ventricosus]